MSLVLKNNNLQPGGLSRPPFIMRKLFFLFFCLLYFPAYGMDLSRVEFFLAAQNLPGAQQALQEAYQKATSRDDKEQLQYMMAQVALRQKDTDRAITIYRNMLAENPALLRVRCEIAFLYFATKQDQAARYHARLALADNHLPQAYRAQLQTLLQAVRRRRSWQLYVSVGMAPDSNVNSMSGKRLECVNVWGLPFCRELEDTEDDIGIQGFASLSYVKKITDQWGLKARLMTDAIDYKDDRYSFWGLGGELGPRFVTNHHEYNAGISYRQQWNDHHRYSHTQGVFAEWNGDLSRRLAARVRASVDKVRYNRTEYQGYDSYNYGLFPRLTLGISNRSYASLAASFIYEKSQTDWNSNFRQRYALGYGLELPWGFNLYTESNITFTNYQHERYFISKHQTLEDLKRKDILYGLFVSLSNKKIQAWGIMPTLNCVYYHRHSNVNNYGYDRLRWEIGLSKSF